MRGTAGGYCGGVAEDGKEEAAGSRGPREWIECCTEGGYCLQRDCHRVGLDLSQFSSGVELLVGGSVLGGNGRHTSIKSLVTEFIRVSSILSRFPQSNMPRLLSFDALSERKIRGHLVGIGGHTVCTFCKHLRVRAQERGMTMLAELYTCI